MDILFINNQQSDHWRSGFRDYLEDSILFFNQLQSTLLYLILPKMNKKVLQNI